MSKKDEILKNLSDLDYKQLTDILFHLANLLGVSLLTKDDNGSNRKTH